jgi:hypothetical protein
MKIPTYLANNSFKNNVMPLICEIPCNKMTLPSFGDRILKAFHREAKYSEARSGPSSL